MACDTREECPAADLVLGHKCGGSDGLSGITANPVVGRLADRLTAPVGRVILTAVPEMFRAAHLLIDPAVDDPGFRHIVGPFDDVYGHFRRRGPGIYEKP